MDRLRLLYTSVLACLLILSGCFGAATIYDAESQTTPDTSGETPATTAETSSNSAPEVTAIQASSADAINMYNSSTGAFESVTGYWVHLYSAMIDIDGVINSSGWDINLDGTIDYSVTTAKAFTNVTIPFSEWLAIPDDDELITTIAFIAIDNDGGSGIELVTLIAEEHYDSNQQDSPDLYQYRASNHNDNPSAATSDNLMVLEFMQAPADLNWANIDVQITGADGVPHTCKTDTSTDCTITQYGSDDTFWEKSEVLHLSENGADLCTGGQCTFDIKITDTRSGTTLTGTTSVIVE